MGERELGCGKRCRCFLAGYGDRASAFETSNERANATAILDYNNTYHKEIYLYVSTMLEQRV